MGNSRNGNAGDIWAMVDFDEKFFICPECGEPVYADDWEDTDFDGVKCPICEWCGD